MCLKWRINISLYADESRECESGIIVYCENLIGEAVDAQKSN